MSKVTLQNTNLDFNVTIVALDEKTNDGISLPLDIGAISNLEIDDNLIDFGITGTITYVNWFQITDKLGITAGRDKSLIYIIVDIRGLDGEGEEEREISFVGLMESNSSSPGGNIADAKQTYSFEEASTSRLKKMSFASLEGVRSKGTILELIASLLEKSRTPYDKESFGDITTPNDEALPSGDPDRPFVDRPFGQPASGSRPGLGDLARRLPSFLSPSTAAQAGADLGVGLLNAGFERLGAIQGVQQGLERAPKLPSQTGESRTGDLKGVNITDFVKKDESLYVITNNLYNALRQGDDIPLLKVETVTLKRKDAGNDKDCVKERQLQYRDMLSDKHKDFIQEYITGASRGTSEEQKDYSEVYQEEFLIGPEERESPNTSPYNKVESYNHIKPDIGQLRQSVWGAYKINGLDEAAIGIIKTDIINFNTFIFAFENNIKAPSNIPPLKDNTDPIEQKIFEVESMSSSPGNTEIIQGIAYNRVLKSFIFRNEAIVLRVKGQIYRKPGVFITIRGGVNVKGKPQTDLWFVISNKHIFNNGNYENEITAVRFLGDAELQSPQDLQQNRPLRDNDAPPEGISVNRTLP